MRSAHLDSDFALNAQRPNHPWDGANLPLEPMYLIDNRAPAILRATCLDRTGDRLRLRVQYDATDATKDDYAIGRRLELNSALPGHAAPPGSACVVCGGVIVKECRRCAEDAIELAVVFAEQDTREAADWNSDDIG